MTPSHPAKYSDSILEVFGDIFEAEAKRTLRTAKDPLYVLDPMAGTGRIHEVGSEVVETWSVELEPEWIGEQDDHHQQGDATSLPFGDGLFDVVATSPAYGNRMADHHNAKDGSRRITYKHQLGRDLSENNGGALQWGDAYRQLHTRILSEMVRVTGAGGLVIINVSNHIRRNVEQFVSEWWLTQMLGCGLKLEAAIPVHTPRMGFGENAKLRVNNEWVFVTRKV